VAEDLMIKEFSLKRIYCFGLILLQIISFLIITSQHSSAVPQKVKYQTDIDNNDNKTSRFYSGGPLKFDTVSKKKS